MRSPFFTRLLRTLIDPESRIMEPPADRADEHILPGHGVERLFGYLVLGMAALAVFTLAVTGLSQIQKFSARAVHSPPRIAPTDRLTSSEEIGANLPTPAR